ncbi:UNVERIFIED_CONTAM: hypothetical protein HDU68_011563 [Siphonaria sp. JEL0065]|nr:hypothetical protein HDU68_011563 [Siphonaria sp. JEL0065]
MTEPVPPQRTISFARMSIFDFLNIKSLSSSPSSSTDSLTPANTIPSDNNDSLSFAFASRTISRRRTNSTQSATIAVEQPTVSDHYIMTEAFPGWDVPKDSCSEVIYRRDRRNTYSFMNSDEGLYRVIHLECSLSPRISDLTFLTVLQLNNHAITGTIPIEIKQLQYLKELCLAGNALSGPLPDSNTFPVSLEILDLSNNEFFAPISTSLCALENLRLLNLGSNRITGRIPNEIDKMQNLRYLHLGNNKMIGEIPASIGNLKNLIVLELQHNKFNGELPNELGNLKNLRSLYLNSNKFYGDLDESIFSNFLLLSQLALNRNQFTGPFPHSLLGMPRLRKLRLDNNYFDEEVYQDDYPFQLKISLHLRLKQFKVGPQKNGTPPHQILPEYSEFSEDLLHPSGYIDHHRRGSRDRRAPQSIFDLPENITQWTPEDVSLWVKVNGGDEEICERIQDWQISGWQFFRFRQEELERALGVSDAGVQMMLFNGIQRELSLVNGLVPPLYSEL